MSKLIRKNGSCRVENMLRDRPVMLHGVDVYEDSCECHGVGESPEIPCLGPLLDLLKANPEANEAQWLAEDNKWYVFRSDAINGN
jgi:hypothetical protein